MEQKVLYINKCESCGDELLGIALNERARCEPAHHNSRPGVHYVSGQGYTINGISYHCKSTKHFRYLERKETPILSVVNKETDNLADLQQFLSGFPDDSTSNILVSDLEAGNFDDAVIVNNLYEFHIHYTGPVAEGYVSPHDQREE